MDEKIGQGDRGVAINRALPLEDSGQRIVVGCNCILIGHTVLVVEHAAQPCV